MTRLRKHLKLTWIALLILVITLSVSVAIGVNLIKANSEYNNVVSATDEYISGQAHINELNNASAYLTNEARMFVATGDPVHAKNYFDEAYSGRREAAIQSVSKDIPNVSEEIIGLLNDALNQSDKLMEDEIHAMALAAKMYVIPEMDLPNEVSYYRFSETELSMSKSDMRTLSFDMVFGDEYQAKRNAIDSSIGNAFRLATETTENAQKTSREILKKSLANQTVLMIVLAAAIIVFALLIYRLVVYPIREYTRSISLDDPMNPKIGSQEFMMFAREYNRLYELNRGQRMELEQQADHDALTGLLNRHAFNRLTPHLEKAGIPFAFMIIDVDKFKDVNDTYGHEVGDLALKKVASLLTEFFRGDDYIIRYGGDEFLIIITEMTSAKRQAVAKKLNEVNSILQHPIDVRLPKLSVSVGCTFSKGGSVERAFRDADAALYVTKENGRCGYNFFEDIKK